MIKYLIYILIVPLFSFGQFYKYATIYAGGSLSQSIPPVENYQYINNQLIETTNDIDYNYRYQIGIKKISRYKFERKPKYYYDGKEKNASIYRSPVDKFEYVLQYERIKDRGFRYIGKYFTIKTQQSNNGYVDLQYKALDIRLKYDFKELRATFGAVARYYPIYNVNAFKNDFSNYNDFHYTIHELGYYSESSWIDGNMNGYFDRWEDATTIWFNQNGDTVANSTSQMQNIYGDIVSNYNKDWADRQGNQKTLSTVVGLSYFKQLDNFFILIYGNYFFYNHNITDYATDTNDFDFGIITNLKLTKSISLYSQLDYLQYFGRENYTINFGINLIII